MHFTSRSFIIKVLSNQGEDTSCTHNTEEIWASFQYKDGFFPAQLIPLVLLCSVGITSEVGTWRIMWSWHLKDYPHTLVHTHHSDLQGKLVY